MSMIGEFGVHAIVLRSKENYLNIFEEKLTLLPWGMEGFVSWIDRPDARLSGRTPMQAIKDGEGYLAEDLVDELEHLHFAVVTLEAARAKYGALTQLAGVWQALDRAMEKLPWS